jgi:hypothetical protein
MALRLVVCKSIPAILVTPNGKGGRSTKPVGGPADPDSDLKGASLEEIGPGGFEELPRHSPLASVD